MTSLHGRVAIVTGGNREIGAAMAEALADAGAAVLIAYYGSPELAESAFALIRAKGGRAATENADLTTVTGNQRIVDRAVEEFGRLDIFVANAGITVWGQFLDVDEAAWDAVVNLNLKGSFFGAQAAARQMLEQCAADPSNTYGRIVFSSSITGVVALPSCSPYAVTKAGLRHMAVVLGLELGLHGITVNALGIGPTVNQRNLGDNPNYEADWSAVTPTGRCGRPEDAAAGLLYLVSPDAAMVNGHTLVIDGGWTTVGRAP